MNVLDEFERTKSLQDYEAVNGFWLVLLKVANRMKGSTEHKRMIALVEKLTTESVSLLLHDPAVDSLLNLRPPLETILASEHERLYQEETQKAMQSIRDNRLNDPKLALLNLGEILKRIRNKREHGFKTADGPRDQEILLAARKLLERLSEMVVIMIQSSTDPQHHKSNE